MQHVVDDVLGKIERGIEQMIASGPAGLDAVRGSDLLFADGVGLQALQMLRAEQTWRRAVDTIAAESDATREECHQVPRFLAAVGRMSLLLYRWDTAS